mgnify:CR=1 FL=1
MVLNNELFRCPECRAPVLEVKQVRCSNCKICFDWGSE